MTNCCKTRVMKLAKDFLITDKLVNFIAFLPPKISKPYIKFRDI